DEVLGLLQAQARDFAHGLDGVHLVLAGGGEDHGELGLLFLGGGATTGRGGGNGDGRGGGGHAELLFHVLDELRELEDGHAGDCVEDFLLGDSHVIAPGTSVVKWVEAVRSPRRPAFPSGRARPQASGRTSRAPGSASGRTWSP